MKPQTPKKLIRKNITQKLKEGEWEQITDQSELNKLYALKIKEELAEIESSGHKDIMEFVDLIQAAFSYTRRNGFTQEQISMALIEKTIDKGNFDSLALNNLNPNNPSNWLYFKPKIVCFCGSTRFADYFMIERWKLEKQGIITFGINYLPPEYGDYKDHIAEHEGVKEILDELHKRKIDLSDEVFVLNVDGYIGESTRNEISYAESIGKPVKYLVP